MDQHAVQMVVLEKVGGMTGQSASAAFTFGYGAGIVEGVLAAMRLPIALVTPQAWKRSAGIATDKGAAREAAMRLWPAHASRFARVKDDGRAEAALIARHGWMSVAKATSAGGNPTINRPLTSGQSCSRGEPT
jgi:crossover junction endodeoxyribonuclease RuvC